MKKFLISLVIGATMIAFGATMLVFEIKDFTFADGESLYETSNFQSMTFDIKDNDLRIILDDDDSISYHWKYDESMKDEARIVYSPRIRLSSHAHTVYVQEGYADWSINDGFRILDNFLDGLRKHTIYTWEYTRDIVIVTSYTNRDRIHMEYN